MVGVFFRGYRWVYLILEYRCSVYDWENGTKLNAFVNANPYGSRISSLKFINEEDMTLVMAASGVLVSFLFYFFPVYSSNLCDIQMRE